MDGGDGHGQRVTRLQAADVPAFGRGAALLGCGGGGRVDHTVSAIRRVGPGFGVPVLSLDDRRLERVAAVGLVGSTTVLEEKMPSGRELPDALAAVERWTGDRADAVLPAQIGGVTGPAAALTAHLVGRPLVDADLVGRATPRLDQLTLFAAGALPVTAAAATSSGLRIVVDAPSPGDLETVWREAVSHSGGWAAFAIGPVPIAALRARAVAGSVTRALRTGRALAAAAGPEALARAVGGRVVALGRVVDVDRAGDAMAFVHSTTAIVDTRTGAVARIEAGSEYVHCLVDGEPVASTPSLIVVVDARSLDPVAADRIRTGDELAVLVLPGADWWWADPVRLGRVAPRAYGVDADVVPEPAGVR
ncbi:DUF917 domain-containing protein [Curtobacterium sp. MCBD17_028]|uniref:DUF917 domain-containing protein n=1 Tax=Curtobacterium sp. MCBD17_028 TaxID=2175670 RepID=UPI000DAAAF6F|nr:DUF917 domain-containing protein [Curtobacterium sp. MCBD17_028]PZE24783.1 DUF917 domain-containing protein [Curtobacterium sp. MCBD17_028]